MCAMRDSVCRRSVTSSWVLIRYCGSPESSSTVMRRVRNSRRPSLVEIGCSSVSRPRFLIAASSRAMISLASRGLKMSAAVSPVASSGFGREYSLGALAVVVIGREAREPLEGAVGKNIAAVLDVLGGDADRHVVEHRFQKLRGRSQLARELALLGAILMGGDRPA